MALVGSVALLGIPAIAQGAPATPSVIRYRPTVGSTPAKVLNGARLSKAVRLEIGLPGAAEIRIDDPRALRKGARLAAGGSALLPVDRLKVGKHSLRVDGGPKVMRASFTVVRPAASVKMNRPLRIMPLGASVTEGLDSAPGGYRIKLEEDLDNAGMRFEFVGSLSNGPPELKRQNHEGHGGWCLAQPCYSDGWADGKVGQWVKNANPDLILLQMGNNDLNTEKSAADTAAALRKVVDQIYVAKPNTTVLVTGLIQDLGITDGRLHEYNASMPAMVRELRTQGRSAYFADMEKVLDPKADYADETHPTPAGSAKIGDAFFRAIRALPVAARSPRS